MKQLNTCTVGVWGRGEQGCHYKMPSMTIKLNHEDDERYLVIDQCFEKMMLSL